jgi:hypothetical protein
VRPVAVLPVAVQPAAFAPVAVAACWEVLGSATASALLDIHCSELVLQASAAAAFDPNLACVAATQGTAAVRKQEPANQARTDLELVIHSGGCFLMVEFLNSSLDTPALLGIL